MSTRPAIPMSQLDEMYERMVQVIEAHGGKAPSRDEPGSLSLIGEFCWALGFVPRIDFIPINETDSKE